METEKRLIDANAMRNDWLENGENEYVYDTNAVLDSIDAQPTVDAVEVVRCKDCKYWEQYNACDGTKPYRYRCMNYDGFFYKRTASDNFCSYGERRDNDT